MIHPLPDRPLRATVEISVGAAFLQLGVPKSWSGPPLTVPLRAAPAFASHGSSSGGDDECENEEQTQQQYRDLFKRWQDLSSTWHW